MRKTITRSASSSATSTNRNSRCVSPSTRSAKRSSEADGMHRTQARRARFSAARSPAAPSPACRRRGFAQNTGATVTPVGNGTVATTALSANPGAAPGRRPAPSCTHGRHREHPHAAARDRDARWSSAARCRRGDQGRRAAEAARYLRRDERRRPDRGGRRRDAAELERERAEAARHAAQADQQGAAENQRHADRDEGRGATRHNASNSRATWRTR